MRRSRRRGAVRRNRSATPVIELEQENPEIPGRPGTRDFLRVSGLIHDISKLRERYFEQQCRLQGVTRAQWWLMHKLCSYEQDPPNQTELARQIGIGVAAAGEMLTRVEKAGYVLRESDPDNRRAKRVAIMGPGRALVASMRDAAHDYATAVKTGLTDQDEALLLALLDRIKGNLLDLVE